MSCLISIIRGNNWEGQCPDRTMQAKCNNFFGFAPTHLLSHQKIFCQAWHVQLNDHFVIPENDQFRWIEPQEFTNLAKPVLLLNLITDNLALKNLF